MRQLFITGFCAFLLINTYGQQNTYFSKFGTQWSDFPSMLITGTHGDIIICSGSYSYSTNEGNTYLARLDSIGNLIRIKIIPDSFLYRNNIIGGGVMDSGYYFLSRHFPSQQPYFVTLSVLQTDFALNLKSETFIQYNDSLQQYGGCAIMDSRGDFIFCGRLAKPGGSTLPYLVKIDSGGNIKNHQFDTFPGYQFGLNTKIIEDFDATGYFLGSQNKSKGGGERILHLDSNFNILSDTIRFPHYMYWVCGLKRQNPDRLIISTNTTNNGNLAIAAFDTLGRMIHFLERTEPGYYIMEGLDPIAVTDSSIFFASYHTLLGNVLFPPINNHIMVQKLDTSFQVLWEAELGWDAYFIYSDIRPTPDGGCIVLASVYDSDTMYMRHDVVLFKIDGSGNLIGITNLTPDTEGLVVFPNPGRDRIEIKGTGHLERIQVFDASGRIVRDLSLRGMPTAIVDMHDTTPGLYIIHATCTTGKTYRPVKWVKR